MKLVDGLRSSQHPLYGIWTGIWNRCSNPNNTRYASYGGRGISVCDRWKDFRAFVADMGPRPSASHSLDRINNDGHYEPGNVRWATPVEQAQNRRPSDAKCALPEIVRVTCDAQLALRSWMSENGMSQSGGGRLFGVSQSAVACWLSGPSRPDHHYRIAIERLCGIPALDWLTEIERRIAFGEEPVPLSVVR